MKTHAKIFGILLLVLAGCSSTYQTAGTYDDIYYSPELVRPASEQDETYSQATVVEVPQDAAEVSGQSGAYAQEEEYVYDDYDNQYYEQEPGSQGVYADGGSVIVNQYYDSGYYDFAYAARLRRFYSPVYYRPAYYDPFFTNMYWYTYNPFYSGVSIYHGFGAMSMYYPGYLYNPAFFWENPYYSMHSYYMGYSGFYGSWSPYSPYTYHMGYHPWPFFHSYHSGYYRGFYSGLHYNPYYYQYIYNSFDPSNYYYGHRNSVGGGTRGRALRPETTFAERFEGSTVRTPSGSREIIARNTTREADDTRGSAGVRQISADRQVRETPRGEVNSPRQGAAGTARPTRTQSGEQRQDERTRAQEPSRQPVTSPRGVEQARPQDPSRRQPQSTPQRGAEPVRQQSPARQTETAPQRQPERSNVQSPGETIRGFETRPANQEEGTQNPLLRRPAEFRTLQGEQSERSQTQRYARPEQARPSTQERVSQPNYTPPRT
ncbi:MAG: hypothetical protein R6U86_10210, partial [Bacteroidales bacterium]